jgi:uncharacterized protein YdhG (YjbR/CyaY superfamily)
MNMFKPTKAKTVEEYMDAVPPERKEAMEAMHAFIRKTVPSLKPYFATNMLGYGSFPWKNSKKELIQWPVIALANQKAHISLFVCAVSDGRYLLESYGKELGKADIGKTSISFKNVEDLNLDMLKTILKAAEKNPGLTGLGKKKSE